MPIIAERQAFLHIRVSYQLIRGHNVLVKGYRKKH